MKLIATLLKIVLWLAAAVALAAGALLGYMIVTGQVNPGVDASFEYNGATFEFGPNGTLYAGAPLDLYPENIADYNF